MQIEKRTNTEDYEIDSQLQQATDQNLCSLDNNDESASITSKLEKNNTICEGCGYVIKDSSFLLVENQVWHVTCLKCCVCALLLNDFTTCFSRNGNIYCREDYQKLYILRSCARCGVMIKSNELVMRVRDLVYHAAEQCFCCHHCKKPLITGEKFLETSTKLICFECFQSNRLFNTDNLYGTNTAKPGRPRKRKHQPISPPILKNIPIFDNDAIHSVTERHNFTEHKSKRVRTSFKHDQLKAMKSYFDLNHNPDAKDLKQLAQETGLTKRVLQVWFQNARAKYRRNCLHKETKNELEKSSETSCSDHQNQSESCLDLSCSDSVSSVYEESPTSEIGSDEVRSYGEISDTISLTSYQKCSQCQQPEKTFNCATTLENKESSPAPSVAEIS